MRGKSVFGRRQKECLGFISFIQTDRQREIKQIREVAELSRGRKKKFVLAVARVSLVHSVSVIIVWIRHVEAVIAPGTLCMQPLELQV